MSERFNQAIFERFKVPKEEIPSTKAARSKKVAELLKKHHEERRFRHLQGLAFSKIAVFRRNAKEKQRSKNDAKGPTFLDRKLQRIQHTFEGEINMAMNTLEEGD